MQTISDIGERGLIKIISDILGELGNKILSGEDDAVAVRIENPTTLVVNTDMLVSTTDVPPQMTMFQAARKAVVMTVSDVLVKGAIPKWAVIALGIPKNLPLEGGRGFIGLIKGLKAGFEEFKIHYLGGDLNETEEIIISCTIFGEAPYGIISRSGAKPGDIIMCTGELGKTGCGFSLLLDGKEAKTITQQHRNQLIESVLNPTTPQNYGKNLALKKWASSSCDSSDGLITTIKEICKASNTGAKISWNLLPIADGVQIFCNEINLDIIPIILASGEEFIHVFTIQPNKYNLVKKYFDSKGLPLFRIGEITNDPMKIQLIHNEKIIDLSHMKGYEHLEKKNKI